MAGPYPGYNCALYVVGTSTAMSAEACSNVTGDIYQITSTAKRILDPATAVVVWDNGAPAGTHTLDYLFGKIEFASTPTTPITVNSANYMPRWEVTTGRAFDLDGSRTIIDDTVFSSNTHRSKDPGLKTWSGSVELLDDGYTDYDTGGTTLTLEGLLSDGTAKCLEIYIGGAGTYWRGWVLFSKISTKTNVDGQAVCTASFTVAPQADSNGDVVVGAAWSDE